MGASGKLLTKNRKNYGGGKIENVDLHPTPPYTPGPGSRARAPGAAGPWSTFSGVLGGWGASPHFLGYSLSWGIGWGGVGVWGSWGIVRCKLMGA